VQTLQVIGVDGDNGQDNSSTDVVDQRLVIEGRFSIERKPAAHFLQQIDHHLGIDVQRVEMLIDREP